MRYDIIASAILLSSISLGCGSSDRAQNPTPAAPTPDEEEPAVTEEPTETTEREPTEALPPARPPTTDEAARFAAANNAFAMDLWGELREREGNLAVSPASITVALSMTMAGARGETRDEMAGALHVADPDGFHEAASAVLGSWNDPERDAYRLAVANRLFGEESFTFEQPFIDLTRAQYRAPLEAVDFRGAPEPSRARINGWVEEQTENRITDLLPDGSIQSATTLVLTNAVYFLADWMQKFDANLTSEAPFYAGGSREVRVPMMRQSSYFGFYEDDDVKLLEMPYEGREISMVAILPKARNGIGALERGLTLAKLDGWLGRLRNQNVQVAFPKVRIEMPESMELSTVLGALGVRKAFDENAADLTGIGRPPNPELRLYISKVFHKAFVEIDEEGTEAAAATAVVVAVGGGPPPQPQATFAADHPFLFMIRDMRSGTILFLGRVTDPS